MKSKVVERTCFLYYNNEKILLFIFFYKLIFEIEVPEKLLKNVKNCANFTPAEVPYNPKELD